MKHRTPIILLLFVLIFIFFIQSCSKADKKPIADFNASPRTGMAPLMINFNDLSSNNPTNWHWEFGDGQISNQQSPDHLYQSPGTFTITLTVSNSTDSDTRKKAAYIVLVVSDSIPKSSFSAVPITGEAPLAVSFSDLTENNPDSWAWDFGDGNISDEQNPVHTYQENGFYTVSLTTSNQYGFDTDTKTNAIKIPADYLMGTFTDNRDNQIYKTVTIGSQTWFAENLNFVSDTSWCYNDNTTFCNIYGRLYNWQTSLVACPEGWHLPDDDEWKILEGSMDTEYGIGNTLWDKSDFRGHDAGKRLKSSTGWFENGSGTNNVNFEVLPAGWRSFYGAYYRLDAFTSFWTSTEKTSQSAIYRRLGYHSDQIGRHDDTKEFGFSVRCIKD